MKTVLIVLAALTAALLLIALIGSLLPRDHVATRIATFHQPVNDLYATVHDFAHQAEWRSNLKAVEILPDRDGKPSFREVTKEGTVPYVVLEDRPDERLVIEIADTNLPYGGTWTFAFSAAPPGSSVRITERGFVKNAFFRFLSRTVFRPTETMERYLRDLGKKLGEAVEPQP